MPCVRERACPAPPLQAGGLGRLTEGLLEDLERLRTRDGEAAVKDEERHTIGAKSLGLVDVRLDVGVVRIGGEDCSSVALVETHLGGKSDQGVDVVDERTLGELSPQ